MSVENQFRSIFEPELIAEIEEVARPKQIEEGRTLIDIGDYIRAVPLVVQGAVKVLREDDTGNELLLYFVKSRDTCAMTLRCCAGHSKSEIKAIAERDTELLMIPVQKMEEWSSKYKTWRNFVFESYHKRLMEALQSVDQVAFSHLDERLINYLKEKSEVLGEKELAITHQEIANELNSSRVVISRLLKRLENEAYIKTGRNKITLLVV